MFMQNLIKLPVHNAKRTLFLGHLDISGVILNDRGQNTNLVARQENKPTIIQVFLCMIKRKKFYDLKI